MMYIHSVLSSALCCLVLSTVGPAGFDSKRAPKQLIADYSVVPTLYSLDAASGEISKSVSHSEKFDDIFFPWVRFEHHRSPWKGAELTYGSSSCKITSFDLRPNKTIVAVDSTDQRLCSFDAKGAAEVLWTGAPLVLPTSVATIGNTAYIADKGANTVFAFSLDTRHFIGSYWDGGVVPDKVVAGRGAVVGMNYSAHMIIQMYLIETEAASADRSVTTGGVFRVHRASYEDIRDPVDFGVDGGAVYVLDQTSSALIYVSLAGSEKMVLRLEGVTADPHPAAMAVAYSDTLRLVFAKYGNGVEVVQNIRPASIYLDKDLGQGIVESYRYLSQRGLLPTEEKKFLDETQFTGALSDVGLDWHGGQHDAVVEILHNLNGGRSEKQLVSHLQSGLVLPAVKLEKLEAKRKVTMAPLANVTQTLGEYVDMLNLPAEPSAKPSKTRTDEARSSLKKLNYSYRGQNISQETSGTFIVPVPAVIFSAFVSSRVANPKYTKTRKIERFGRVIPLSGTGIKIQSTGEEYGQLKNTPSATAGSKHSWDAFIFPCQVDGVGQSTVGIVDFQFDQSHPEFLGTRRVSKYHPPNVSLPTETDSSAASGGTSDYPAMVAEGLSRSATENDHGTHVAAIAAGALTGVNPHALIDFVSINDFPTATADATSPINIYNLSLGEKYYDADETETLRSWSDTVGREENDNLLLFVIAAGNDHVKVAETMLGWAGRRSNVIVVAASDIEAAPPREWLDGDQKHGSNFGDRVVGLYAPGKDIVSATFDGLYARASGTSQAAAFVSGAASLLKGLEPTYVPWQIKERLISTSTLDGWIDQNHSKGGMLNVCRAIQNRNKTVIRFSYEGTECVADVVPPSEPVQIYNDPHWSSGPVTFSHIRRIHRLSPDGDEFELFISYTDPEENERHLYRTAVIHSADLVAPELKLVNTSHCGGKTTLDLSLIDDLYNPVLP